ncbi:NAD-dependent protein deacetylase sirtuin-2 [Chytriomyces hyalinus]|nr:NAD-dependent protein deacetylase sirtuin-2 [Chytriomyces hyalinus]
MAEHETNTSEDVTQHAFEGECPRCYEPSFTRMNVLTHSGNEIIVMTTDCESCLYKSSEIRTGGAISPVGMRTVFHVRNEASLTREVLKAETCSFRIPELDLDLTTASMGTQFMSLRALIKAVYQEIERTAAPLSVAFASDPKAEQRRGIFERLLAKLTKALNVETPYTIVLDDPLGTSFLQNIYAPDPDPDLTTETYERTVEQNEDYGLNDLNVDDYQNDGEEEEEEVEEEEAEPILSDSSIQAFAKYIQENNCKNIVVLTGAGISTSAGIPDFRSPETGLYSNLEKYNLPSPESVFDINYFWENPNPFFLLAKELYPGNFKPTIGHYFVKQLSEKGILLRNFTQNIDTLERVAGIDEEYLVEAHGSFGSASCVGHYEPLESLSSNDPRRSMKELIPSCGRKFTQEWVKEKVFANTIPRCPDCAGLVKPDITFFGEKLPKRFMDRRDEDLTDADALIVIGTSLKVVPFAHLPDCVRPHVPRLLINNDLVGDFDADSGRDAIFLGSCDDGCLLLAELLGFKEDLIQMAEGNNGKENNTEKGVGEDVDGVDDALAKLSI